MRFWIMSALAVVTTIGAFEMYGPDAGRGVYVIWFIVGACGVSFMWGRFAEITKQRK